MFKIEGCIPRAVKDNARDYGTQRRAPTAAKLQSILNACLTNFENIWVVLDSIERCEPSEDGQVLVRSLLETRNCRLLASTDDTFFSDFRNHLPKQLAYSEIQINRTEEIKKYMWRELNNKDIIENLEKTYGDKPLESILENAPHGYIQLASQAVLTEVTPWLLLKSTTYVAPQRNKQRLRSCRPQCPNNTTT